MEKNSKNKIEILARKANIDRANNITDFSKVSGVLFEREQKLKKLQLQLEKKREELIELERGGKAKALFSGDGQALREFLDKKKQVNLEVTDLESKVSERKLELSRAEQKYEQSRGALATSQAKSSKLDQISERTKIDDLENKNYVEEINSVDLGSRANPKNPRN